MINWKETTLGDLVRSGFILNHNNKRVPLSSDVRSKIQGEYPYYGAASAIDFIDDYKFDGFFLLIAEDGTVFDGKAPMLQLVNGKFWVSNHSHVLQGRDSQATKLLYYALRNVSVAPYITGAVQPKLTKENLYNISFPFPESEIDQEEVVSILSSLDDKIELLRGENKTLEATAQAIFKEWFVNFNFPNIEGKPYKSSGGKMIDSELGEIPEGWRVGQIKDLINIFSGFAFSSTGFIQHGKYKLVTIKNVQDRYFVQDIKDTFDDLPSKMPQYCHLKTGDILLSLTGNVGRICLVVGGNYLLNQRVAKLETINKKDHAFAYLLFLQESIFSLLQSTASGTAQQNLSPVQTKGIEILISSREVLDAFGDMANPMIEKINQNNLEIQTLSTLRDILLPKLMSGEIRIEGVNN